MLMCGLLCSVPFQVCCFWLSIIRRVHIQMYKVDTCMANASKNVTCNT